MNASVFDTVARSASRVTPSVALRLLLLAGLLFATAAAALIGDPSSFVAADPELSLLLRGMAALKGALVAAALALALWRFDRPIAAPMASAYVAGVSTMAFATVLIWQLSFIVGAAVLFHAAGLLLLIVAWRDDGRPALVPRRRA